MPSYRNTLSSYDCSPAPCESCYKRRMCAAQRLACNDLLWWTGQGVDATLTYPAGRVALSTIYQKLFPGEGE